MDETDLAGDASRKEALRRGFALGPFDIHPTLSRVEGPEGRTRLEPRIMAVLVCLASRAGALVSRDELFRQVWGPAGATDDVLSRAISSIRKSLGESSKGARLIETIPKAGYRLTLEPGPLVARGRAGSAPLHPSRSEATGRVESARRWRFSDPPARLVLGAVLAVLVTAALSLLRPWMPGSISEQTAYFEPGAQPLSVLDGDEMDPAVSPDGARVAFAWRREAEGFFDLQIIEALGARPSARRRLTATPEQHERSPAWSPEGTHLAFIRSGQGCEVVVLDVLRKSEMVVYECDQDRFDRIRWSPTGGFLVLRGRPKPNSTNRLFRFDVDLRAKNGGTGRAPYAITSPPPDSPGDYAFAISPDGRSVILARHEVEAVADLYVLDIPSGALRRLTHRRARIYDILWSESEWAFASTGWTPERGVWRVSTENGNAELVAGTATELRDMAGGQRGGPLVFRQLHNDVDLIRVSLADAVMQRTALIGSTRADSKPALSPDGLTLAFESNRSGPYEVWVSDLDGANARQITDFGGVYNGYPRWSPTGSHLVLEAHHDGQADIYAVDATDGAIQQLTDDPGQDVTPSWSANGSSVFFASNRTGRWEVWGKEVVTGTVSRLTHSGGMAPQASADGRHVYYVKPYQNGIWRTALTPAEGAAGVEELVLASLPVGDYSAWALTPEGIVYLDRPADHLGGTLRRLDMTTGVTTDLGRTESTPLYYGGISVSPGSDCVLIAIQSRLESDLGVFPRSWGS